MMDETEAEMTKGTSIICEASFSYNGLYCAVDILKKDGDGWSIYEVKSSTKHQNPDGSCTDDKEVYIADISYQKYVLEHCGVKVTGTYLVCLNGDYVYDGNMDFSSLFFISDVTEEVKTEIHVTVTAQVNEMAMTQFAKSYAPDVLVLEPRELADKVKADAKRMVAAYEKIN